jgi:hypothetical protein
MKRIGMTVDIIDLGWFYCLFIVFDQGNWPYFLLLLVDLSHLSLTIWGSIEFFKDLRQIIICYLEVPVLANFMFVLIIIGYAFAVRSLVTIFHFKFGPFFWRLIRRTCPCFRRFDPQVLRARFPQHSFGDY